MSAPRSLSVVIPVLNEEAVIEEILDGVARLGSTRGGEWEILVVDNASTDGTVKAAEAVAGRLGGDAQHIRILVNDENRGKGYSIRRGMLAAKGELRLMCDADCVASLASLADLERAIVEGGCEIAVGSRNTEGAKVGRPQAIRRRIVGFGFIELSRIALGKLPKDIYCGFKLWTGEAADAVFSRVTLEGWVFDAEALALARKLGLSWREVGIAWVNRPDSRLTIRNVLLPVIGELRRARRSVRDS